MLFTLIVPFAFMLFMSVSMNRVWGLYNLMQLICNLLRYEQLLIPAPSAFLLKVVGNVSNFSVLKEQNVQNWLKNSVFKHAEALEQFLFEQGMLMLSLYLLVPSVIVTMVLVKVFKNGKLVQIIKRKLMWSSIFRSQI